MTFKKQVHAVCLRIRVAQKFRRHGGGALIKHARIIIAGGRKFCLHAFFPEVVQQGPICFHFEVGGLSNLKLMIRAIVFRAEIVGMREAVVKTINRRTISIIGSNMEEVGPVVSVQGSLLQRSVAVDWYVRVYPGPCCGIREV